MKRREQEQQTETVKHIIARAGEYKGEDADTWYKFLLQDLSEYLMPSLQEYERKTLIYKLVGDARRESTNGGCTTTIPNTTI